MEPEVSTRYITADSLLYAVAHRPWLPPDGPWAAAYNWNDVLFLHYALPPEAVRPLLPHALSLDLFAESAWVSVVALRVRRLRWNKTPAIPFLSSFPMVVLRTYATLGNRPGIYCFSFDAASLGAVWFARLFLHLPYWHADVRLDSTAAKRDGAEPQGRTSRIAFRARRIHGPRAAQEMPTFRAVYSPAGEPFATRLRSLESFLLERYCYYASTRGRIYRCETHHLPWSIQEARVEVQSNTLAEAAGLPLPAQPSLMHFARSLRVLLWPAENLPLVPPDRVAAGEYIIAFFRSCPT